MNPKACIPIKKGRDVDVTRAHPRGMHRLHMYEKQMIKNPGMTLAELSHQLRVLSAPHLLKEDAERPGLPPHPGEAAR